MGPNEWWQGSVEQAIEKTYYTGSISCWFSDGLLATTLLFSGLD